MTSPNPVRPLDLSNLLKHAFLAGTGCVAPECDTPDWVDYDPNECPAYQRIAAMLSAAKPPASGVDAVAVLADPVAVHMNMLRGAIAKPSLNNIAHLYPEVQQMKEALLATLKHFRWPTSAEHETRDKVTAALAHFDNPPLTPSASLSPAATSGSEAGGEAPICYNTGLRCLAGCDGRTCAGANVPLNQWPEPASSPAGGDVRDGALGWNSPEEWEIEQRAFHAAGRDDVPKDVQELVAILWKQYCIAAEPSAAMSPSTSAAEPVAFMAYDQMRAITQRELDTIPEANGRRSNCKALYPTALYATPPAPAAVDGQRVKALVWNEYETEGEVDRWDAETALGTFYEISTQFDGYHVARDCTHLAARFDTLDEAKAAAQVDYEARIRACLATDKEGA